MQWPGHVGIVLLLYAPVAYVLRREGSARRLWVGAAVLLALVMSPDIDLYVPALVHRGLTHTVWAAFALGGLVAVGGVAAGAVVESRTGAVVGRISPTRAADLGGVGFQLGTLSVLAHLLGDVLTPMGIRPLAPFHPGGYSLELVSASDPTANAALLGCGLVAFGLSLAGGIPHESPTTPVTNTGPAPSDDGREVVAGQRGEHRETAPPSRTVTLAREAPRQPDGES